MYNRLSVVEVVKDVYVKINANQINVNINSGDYFSILNVTRIQMALINKCI